ncbi:hypothetical protein BC830DRAFT_390338 [Chytriomyces sp. MP71]|nr:hypothetical protein BC830DRAFT_390338 [Chytriomyces sp. MP71]
MTLLEAVFQNMPSCGQVCLLASASVASASALADEIALSTASAIASGKVSTFAECIQAECIEPWAASATWSAVSLLARAHDQDALEAVQGTSFAVPILDVCTQTIDCAKIKLPENATTINCVNGSCEVSCFSGFSLSGGACVKGVLPGQVCTTSADCGELNILQNANANSANCSGNPGSLTCMITKCVTGYSLTGTQCLKNPIPASSVYPIRQPGTLAYLNVAGTDVVFTEIYNANVPRWTFDVSSQSGAVISHQDQCIYSTNAFSVKLGDCSMADKWIYHSTTQQIRQVSKWEKCLQTYEGIIWLGYCSSDNSIMDEQWVLNSPLLPSTITLPDFTSELQSRVHDYFSSYPSVYLPIARRDWLDFPGPCLSTSLASTVSFANYSNFLSQSNQFWSLDMFGKLQSRSNQYMCLGSDASKLEPCSTAPSWQYTLNRLFQKGNEDLCLQFSMLGQSPSLVSCNQGTEWLDTPSFGISDVIGIPKNSINYLPIFVRGTYVALQFVVGSRQSSIRLNYFTSKDESFYWALDSDSKIHNMKNTTICMSGDKSKLDGLGMFDLIPGECSDSLALVWYFDNIGHFLSKIDGAPYSLVQTASATLEGLKMYIVGGKNQNVDTYASNGDLFSTSEIFSFLPQQLLLGALHYYVLSFQALARQCQNNCDNVTIDQTYYTGTSISIKVQKQQQWPFTRSRIKLEQ